MKANEPDAPAFVAYYDLLGWILDRVGKFPKSRRFVFGQRLSNHAIDVLELIVTALYSRAERRKALSQANLHFGDSIFYSRATLKVQDREIASSRSLSCLRGP